MDLDLPLIWALLIAAAVFLYVVLDGFDLGLGILYPFFPTKKDRDLMMNSVAPVWDGNETWLVLGGGGLFAAFPLAYAIILTATYPLIIAMLLALVFRGVSFEFRWRSGSGFSRWLWDAGFIGGSTVAAMSQGMILGTLLQGIEVEGRNYAGGWWDWLTPFTLLCGVSVVVGYALLGACWLNIKTEGAIQERARGIARVAGLLTVAGIVAVSAATPFLETAYFERWLAWPGILEVAIVPVLVAVLTLWLARALTSGRGPDWLPMILSLALFGLCFVGLGLSMWPHVIPPAITLQQAAAPASSQLFMLVGAVVLIPIILGYTAYAYWVFRGKLDPDEGYH